MSDTISRQAAIDALHMHLMYRMGTDSNKKRLDEWINNLPSAQPEERTEKRTDAFALPEIIVLNEYDTIESEDGRTGFGVYVPEEKKIYVAGDVPQEMKLKALFHELAHWVQDVSGIDFDEDTANELSEIIYDAVVPEETHDKRTETHACDCISRQAAIDAMGRATWAINRINELPSAQPEQLERCPIYDGVCGYPSDRCYECPRHYGAQPEQRWIPVSERLPEKDGRYQVTRYD